MPEVQLTVKFKGPCCDIDCNFMCTLYEKCYLFGEELICIDGEWMRCSPCKWSISEERQG